MCETMECVCGRRGTISERESGDNHAVVACGACGWTMRVEGLALIVWGYRATRLDPDGDLWKSAARMG